MEDCLGCLVEILDRPDVVGEVINIGPDEEFISINQLYETIADLVGFKGEPIYMPGRPQEVRLATCSADKARKLLGYETKVDLRHGLQSMIQYISAQGARKFRYHLELEIVNENTPRTWRDRLF